MPQHPMTMGWVALAAFLVGLIIRALKSDGMASALAHLGLPPIPTRALPWVALALGGIAAGLDTYLTGASPEQAAQAGIMAASVAVFGHELGSGVPGVKKLLGFVLVVGSLSTLTGCAFLQSDKGQALTDLLAKKTECVLKNMDRKPVEWIALCGLQEGDLEQYERLASTARAERDAAVQRDRAEAGACRPTR